MPWPTKCSLIVWRSRNVKMNQKIFTSATPVVDMFDLYDSDLHVRTVHNKSALLSSCRHYCSPDYQTRLNKNIPCCYNFFIILSSCLPWGSQVLGQLGNSALLQIGRHLRSVTNYNLYRPTLPRLAFHTQDTLRIMRPTQIVQVIKKWFLSWPVDKTRQQCRIIELVYHLRKIWIQIMLADWFLTRLRKSSGFTTQPKSFRWPR